MLEVTYLCIAQGITMTIFKIYILGLLYFLLLLWIWALFELSSAALQYSGWFYF